MRVPRLPLLVSALFLALLPLPATAGTSVVECVFDEPSAVATVTPADFAATIAVDSGSITVDGMACGAATVTTTDTILVEGGGGPDVTISLAGGAFAPGLTDEGDGSSEIEFEFTPWDGDLTILGSAGPDDVTAWFETSSGVTATAFTSYLSLNADGATLDADVVMSDGVPGLTSVHLGAGDDRFAGAEAGLTPYTGALFIQGGEGDDTIAPGSSTYEDSFYFGGSGTDTFSFAPIEVSCPTMFIQHGGELICDGSMFSGGVFERLVGHAGVDWLGGGARLAEVRGLGGDDMLFAGPGDGLIDGGVGHDLAAFNELPIVRGVRVDLREGTAQGGGRDVLSSIEDVYGTGSADRLLGNARGNTIRGSGGDDVLLGRAGIDTLEGGDGSDACDVGAPGIGETAVECER